MALSETFRKALEQKDIRMVRIIIKDSLVVDPTFMEMEEMLREAARAQLDLYDPHSGEELERDREQWNKAYMDSQMSALLRNFSRERLDLLKEICTVLYAGRIQNIREKREDQARGSQETPSHFVAGGVLLALALGAAALLWAVLRKN